MDRDWMRRRLVSFDETAKQYWSVRQAQDSGDMERRWLFEAEPTVMKILSMLGLPAGETTVLTTSDWGGLDINLDPVQRGIGMLADMEDWATHLAPDSPSLLADQMHPWVWDAARTLWESAHYRAAVHAAATSINAHLQNKLSRRDLSDAKLIQEALSDKAPEPSKPRLRIPGDQSDPGVQTRQRGALQLGQGAYFALRNPAAHEMGELSEQEALEQLATFSIVARFIDQCQVVTAA
ncbi:TIGR02391 family protein [Streptomyces fungicidicus]|nr:TIGR02391 family protein [Streptomyces fungicidicus]